MEKGQAPEPVDGAEAERVAEAVALLDLSYVVLTAVARDDLADHGAGLFTAAMAAIRRRSPAVAIEVLTPDFWGGQRDPEAGVAAQRQRLAAVLAAGPVCFNHNLETVERLQGRCAAVPPTAAPWGCWRRPGSWPLPSPPRAA